MAAEKVSVILKLPYKEQPNKYEYNNKSNYTLGLTEACGFWKDINDDDDDDDYNNGNNDENEEQL